VRRQQPEPEPFLTADELARLLKVHREWVYDQAAAGAFPSHRLPGGRQLRFLWSEVFATIAQPAAVSGS
jgi:excisionase family DNA binding protein